MVMEEYWRNELPEVKTREIKLKPGSDLITLTPPNHREHIITNCNMKHAFMI
ncbi:MAG: hypothetical protein WBD09_02135 [Halobacteriota archaeon]